jgi:hypothetical protein
MLLARLLIAAAIAVVLFDPQIALAQEQKRPTAESSSCQVATRSPPRSLCAAAEAVAAGVEP